MSMAADFLSVSYLLYLYLLYQLGTVGWSVLIIMLMEYKPVYVKISTIGFVSAMVFTNSGDYPYILLSVISNDQMMFNVLSYWCQAFPHPP